ncbi:plasmid partition protein ParG [Serratia marcescens]|uniref:plasmid partition protein ParG n=1 Tax=Serratia TaxID=613 RepID=UPI0009B58E00
MVRKPNKGQLSFLTIKKLQMNINEDQHKRFKLACLRQDKEMTEITIVLISNWLRDND